MAKVSIDTINRLRAATKWDDATLRIEASDWRGDPAEFAFLREYVVRKVNEKIQSFGNSPPRLEDVFRPDEIDAAVRRSAERYLTRPYGYLLLAPYAVARTYYVEYGSRLRRLWMRGSK